MKGYRAMKGKEREREIPMQMNERYAIEKEREKYQC